MKKFIKKILFLILILCVCLLSLVSLDYFIVGPQYQYSYQASLIDKVKRLKKINEPKIILVGNSNLSFGINSELIEKSLEMPVVNLGLHAGLGNAYHEEIAKLNINKGDIVVVCHSTFSDDDTITDASLAWITYDWNQSIAPIIRKKDYLTMLKAYPTYFKSSLLLWLGKSGNKDQGGCYSRNAFNKYGDVVYKTDDDQMNVEEYFKNEKISLPKINSTCINRLNDLNSYCKKRGASMVVAGYPIAYGKYSEFTKLDFIKFQNKLSKRLNCNIISNYTDYFYPYKYFYNTSLHLTKKGTNIRTKQLINDLEKWINNK